jgi:hypothetical protein
MTSLCGPSLRRLSGLPAVLSRPSGGKSGLPKVGVGRFGTARTFIALSVVMKFSSSGLRRVTQPGTLTEFWITGNARSCPTCHAGNAFSSFSNTVNEVGYRSRVARSGPPKIKRAPVREVASAHSVDQIKNYYHRAASSRFVGFTHALCSRKRRRCRIRPRARGKRAYLVPVPSQNNRIVSKKSSPAPAPFQTARPPFPGTCSRSFAFRHRSCGRHSRPCRERGLDAEP